MLEPQNFSVYAGTDVNIFIDIDPDDEITLVGADIVWRVYEQAMGLPTDVVILEKNNGVDGTLVVDDPATQTLKVPLVPVDTIDLLRNYYHECSVIDETRGTIVVANGIMTVLNHQNRGEVTT